MESIVKMGVKTPGKKQEPTAGRLPAAEESVSGGREYSGSVGNAAGFNYSGAGRMTGAEGGFSGFSSDAAFRQTELPKRSAGYGASGYGQAGAANTGSGRELPPDGPTAEELKAAHRAAVKEKERQIRRERRIHYQMIAAYVVVTFLACYVLLRLTDNLGTVIEALGRLIHMVGMLLAPLFWGFVLAYILAPMVRFWERRLRGVWIFNRKSGGRRAPAVAITCLLTLLVLLVICSVVVSAVSKSLKVASPEDLITLLQSFAGTLDSFQKTVQKWLTHLNISSDEISSALRELGQRFAKISGSLSSDLTGILGHIGNLLTGVLFAVIFCVYFLLDGRGLTRYWNRVLLAIGGKKARHTFHILVQDADAVFSGYIRGQLIDAFIMAILVSAALSLIGFPYAIIIGILSGVGNLIPYLGPVIAYGSTILVSLMSGDMKKLLVAIVVLFVIQTVDGNVINPKLLSSSIDVHPMLVIAALIIGGSFGGIVGMLFAVPVAAFFHIQFDKIIDSLLRARGHRSGSSHRKGRDASAHTDAHTDRAGTKMHADKTGHKKEGSSVQTEKTSAGRSGASAQAAKAGLKTGSASARAVRTRAKMQAVKAGTNTVRSSAQASAAGTKTAGSSAQASAAGTKAVGFSAQASIAGTKTAGFPAQAEKTGVQTAKSAEKQEGSSVQADRARAQTEVSSLRTDDFAGRTDDSSAQTAQKRNQEPGLNPQAEKTAQKKRRKSSQKKGSPA